MPQRWQMRIAGALPVGTESSVCSWCFVKFGSSVEIARPVVVSEKGDSRVSRKWERLALRGSMVVSFGFVLGGAVQEGAVGVCAVRRRLGVRIQLALFYPQDYGFDGESVRAVEPYVSALQRCTAAALPCTQRRLAPKKSKC